MAFCKKVLSLIIILIGSGPLLHAQKTVRYDLYVRDTLIHTKSKTVHAYSVNGQIPMPTLYFTEGDTADIYVHNELQVATSIHWHGLILPNDQDGVPNLTTAPIKANTTHHFHFPIVQNGTYWYHSHTKLQEQSGMYGALIIHKKKNDPTFRPVDQLPEYVMILSDFTTEKPFEIHRKLHNASDYYALRKNSVQSYAEAIKAGHFNTKLKNEWKRMLAMDVSDVYYDQFLINGVNQAEAPQFKPGQKVRLRIANGGASTYFWLKYSGGKMQVIASDGADVEPVEVDRLIIAVSETYDVVVTLPFENTAFELLATSEDRTKSASLWIGSGIKQLAAPLPRLKYFDGMQMMNDMMKMNGDLDDMGMRMSLNTMDMNTVMYSEVSGASTSKKHQHADNQENTKPLAPITTLNYAMLKSPLKTTLPANAPVKTLRFELSGNMNRYVWSLDNKTVSETDKILIKQGENVRIVLYNGSMMRHPMHLHGHFFRVVNGQGDYAPLKNVIDIMPMETDTLEFNASEKTGDWFFHCHILYHMMSGMGRIFSYENSLPNPELPDKKKADRKLFRDDRAFHFMARNDFASNGNDGEAMLQNTRWALNTGWRLGYNDHHGYEVETHLGRYFGKMQWLYAYVGYDWRYRAMDGAAEDNIFGQVNSKDKRAAVCAGIQYTLPMLLLAEARVDSDGKLRLQLMREDIPVTKRLRMALMVNTDKEYMGGFRYIVCKYASISAHYDSDMGFGAGLSISY